MAGNIASEGGGSCIIPSSPGQGSALAGDATLINCIVWGNWDGELGGTPAVFGNPTISHSVIQGGWDGEVVMDVDPMFVADPPSDDYRLMPGSPAINLGSTAVLPVDTFDIDMDGDVDELLPIDLDGLDRVSGDAVDVGAYEFQIAIGDLTLDGTVDPVDLAQLLGAWGPCADPRDCPEDLNGDGTVGPADLAQLLGSWG